MPGPDAAIELRSRGLRGANPRSTHYRIDREHSNSYAAWQRMGSPIAPDKAAYDALRAAGQLAALSDEPRTSSVRASRCASAFALPRQGVSLLLLIGSR